MLTPADLMVLGMGERLVQVELEPVPPGTRCAVTGVPITDGARTQDVITSATTEFLDAFRGGVDGWVAPNVARCFRSASPSMGNPCALSCLAFLVRDGMLTRCIPEDASEALAIRPVEQPELIGWTPPQWMPALFRPGWRAGTRIAWSRSGSGECRCANC